MTLSFWKKSPGPTWTDRFLSFISPAMRYPYPIRRDVPYPSTPWQQRPNCVLRNATPADVDAICKFLHTHYTITERSVCVLEPSLVERFMEDDTWCWILAFKDKRLVGTICSRSLGTCLYGKETSGIAAGYIDFFCVAPDERNTGIGTALLTWIEHATTLKKRLIHFFLKEFRSLPMLPPLWNGLFIARAITPCLNSFVLQYTDQDSFTQADISFWPTFPPQETPSVRTYRKKPFHSQRAAATVATLPIVTRRYYLNGMDVIITDTFHVEKDTGAKIGQVLAVEFASKQPIFSPGGYPVLARTLETILDSAPFSYILMDSTHPHLPEHGWVKDSPYSVYCYNTIPPKWRTLPAFWF